MRRLDGVVQHYAWGDERAIPELLGIEPDGRPWAELWFGTHPGGPSTVDGGGLLEDVTGTLPYLLKVLAAAEPLSLQAHPSAERASAGHSERRYADPSAKPELLCALSPFDALCGVRPPEATATVLDEIGADDLARRLERDGVARVVSDLYRGHLDPDETLAACARSSHDAALLVNELARRYPNDPSVVVTLLLNRVLLDPGEAIYLGPGNLHAYLGGAGVELMAASDNVVRGGLTTKPVDVEELLTVFDPEPLPEPVLVAEETSPGKFRYAPSGAPFVLWRIETDDTPGAGTDPYRSAGDQIALCTAGGDASWPTGTAFHLAPDDHLNPPAMSTLHIAATPTPPPSGRSSSQTPVWA